MKKQEQKKSNKKQYTTPKVTTHGQAAKLTQCEPVPSCHSHLPVIPCPHEKSHRG